MRLLITGGAGFIGSNFIHYWNKIRPDDEIVNLDALTYAGNLENLKDLKILENEKNYKFIKGSITDIETVRAAMKNAQVVVHFAAESHVDRSIDGPGEFIQTNIVGSQIMFDVAREMDVEKFVHVSTDEVYGSLGKDGYFTEDMAYAPNSPYSASKASSDLLARAYFKTYGFPVMITHCSNNYGAYQFPEKFIPLFMIRASMGKELPLYGDGSNIRDWIHVEDHCRGIGMIIEQGEIGETYNFGGECERSNLEIAKFIVKLAGRDESLIRLVKDRPGHDMRYAIDISKVREKFKFAPSYKFEDAMSELFTWYMDNKAWWQRIMSGEYQKFYEQWYGEES